MESANFFFESPVVAGEIVEVSLADIEVMIELSIHLCNFVVFGKDKVDLQAGILQQ